MTETAVVLVLMIYGLVCLAGLLGLVAFGWVAGYGAGYQHGRRGRKPVDHPSFLSQVWGRVRSKLGGRDV